MVSGDVKTKGQEVGGRSKWAGGPTRRRPRGHETCRWGFMTAISSDYTEKKETEGARFFPSKFTVKNHRRQKEGAEGGKLVFIYFYYYDYTTKDMEKKGRGI